MKYKLEIDTLVKNENGDNVVLPKGSFVETINPVPTIPHKDAYAGGPCPVCGLFACRTYRHLGAPVECLNGHMWFRNTQVMASGPGDVYRG